MPDGHRTDADDDRRAIDWLTCPLAETVADKLSGTPVLVGTRMPVAAIADNFDAGMEPAEIAAQFDLPIGDVIAVLEFRESVLADPAR